MDDILNLLKMGAVDTKAGFFQKPRTEEENLILLAIEAINNLDGISRHTVANYVTVIRADRCLSASGGKPQHHCGQVGCPFAEVLS